MFYHLDNENDYDMDYDDWCEKTDNAFLRSLERERDPDPFYDPSHNNNTSRPMEFTGKGKSMAKNKTSKAIPANLTDADKLKHYGGRVNDKTLTDGQRRWAARRVEQLTNKLSAPASPSSLPPITDRCCAESAGIGYGRAKSGQRVAVDKSVKSDFINGVKCGRSK